MKTLVLAIHRLWQRFMARSRTEAGDIVLIPLERGYGMAKVLFLSERYKHVALLGVYRMWFESTSLPATLPQEFALLHYADCRPITDGRWIRLGNQPLSAAEAEIPPCIVGNAISHKDRYIREATSEDYKSIMSMIVSGPGAMEWHVGELLGVPSRQEVGEVADPPLTLSAPEWIAALLRSHSTTLVDKTLAGLIDAEYAEADECYEALAAAEVVAALCGAPLPELPDDIAKWVEDHRKPLQSKAVETARAAVERVRTDSEIKQLWEEGEDRERFEAAVNDLLERLTR